MDKTLVLTPVGNAPPPDARRVEVIASDHAQTDPALFGRDLLTGLRTAVEQLLVDVRGAEPAPARAALDSIEARLATLDPRRLVPARGVAGWFDGHGPRLARFRTAFTAARADIDHALRALDDHRSFLERRDRSLSDHWTALRDHVAEFDAHVVAGMRLLEGQPPAEPVDGAADPAPPHPLVGALGGLANGRNACARQLPLIRAAANAGQAEAETVSGLSQAATAWRDEWTRALGLDGRKPKKVRPTPDALDQARVGLMTAIARARAALDQAASRRAEVEPRLARAASPALSGAPAVSAAEATSPRSGD